MDSLRIALIFIGAVLLAALYLWGWFKEKRHRSRYRKWNSLATDDEHPVAGRNREKISMDHGQAERVGSAVADMEPDVPRVPTAAAEVQLPDSREEVKAPVTAEVDNHELEQDLETLGRLIADLKSEMPQDLLLESGQDLEAHGEQAETAGKRAAEDDLQQVIVLNVMARGDKPYQGDELCKVFSDADLRYGKKGIFHRYSGDEESGAVVFSVANILEPGIFVPESLQGFSTPGILIFMRIPGPVLPGEAFDSMLRFAQNLVGKLGGDLFDETRSVLTSQGIERIREQFVEYSQLRKRAPGGKTGSRGGKPARKKSGKKAARKKVARKKK